jgi:hypothetical protein
MEENKSQIIIYQTENGEKKLDVRFQDETVWITQKLMAELFQTSSQNITIHLKNIPPYRISSFNIQSFADV